jgi:hypothetical protein
VKAKLSKKSKKKKRIQSVISNPSTQQIPQKITAAEQTFPSLINAIDEYQDLKKRTMQLFSKSTSTKKVKSSHKKPRKSNFLKSIEEDFGERTEKLVIAERKNSPTTTSDCNEKFELAHDIDMQREDYLRDKDTEITENSIIFLDNKDELDCESTIQNQTEIPEQKEKRKGSEERPFFPFMRKLHCEIAYTARTANSYCEALLPTCNKIKEHIDSILQSIDKSKV